jgi:penicillin-binding protein 1C
MKLQRPNWKKTGRGILLTVAACFLLLFILHLLFPLPDKVEYSTLITDNKGEVIHAFLTKR